MTRIRVRSIDFVGMKEYPQGFGMTWDDIDVVVDLGDDEEIVHVEKGYSPGKGFDMEVAWVRIWIAQTIGKEEVVT